jgi:hypothetical protein
VYASGNVRAAVVEAPQRLVHLGVSGTAPTMRWSQPQRPYRYALSSRSVGSTPLRVAARTRARDPPRRPQRQPPLVADGAAAPYFYDHRRGRVAARLELLARRARARHLGIWGRCPHSRYDPYHGVATQL